MIVRRFLKSERTDIFRKKNSRALDESGAVAVEFAIIAAVFLPIALIAFDFGLYFRDRIAVDDAMTMGQQSLTVKQEAVEEAVGRIRAALSASIRDQNASVSIDTGCLCGSNEESDVECEDDTIAYTITIVADYASLFQINTNFLGLTLNRQLCFETRSGE